MDSISLFSPLTYHQIHEGNSSLYAGRVDINLIMHEVVIQIDRKIEHLPTVIASALTYYQKRYIGIHYRS